MKILPRAKGVSSMKNLAIKRCDGVVVNEIGDILDMEGPFPTFSSLGTPKSSPLLINVSIIGLVTLLLTTIVLRSKIMF